MVDTLRFAGSPLGTAFTVEIVSGHEALSDLFEFRVDASLSATTLGNVLRGLGSNDRPEPPNATSWLVGHRVALEFGGDGAPTRYGLVYRVEYLDDTLTRTPDNDAMDSLRLYRYRFWVKPRASILVHRRNTRIFQAKYPHEIVHDILLEAGIPHRWVLDNTYSKRIYCTQYEETDWEFLTRLLAEEGIFFYFDHGRPDGELTPEEKKSNYDDVVGYIAAGGALVKALGAIPGDNAGGTIVTGVGSLGGMAADLAGRPEADPEDPEPRPGGSGYWPNAAEPSRENESKEPTKSVMGDDVLVFSDVVRGYAMAMSAVEPAFVGHEAALVLEPPGSSNQDPAPTWDFGRKRAIAPRVAEIRDYNFRRPLDLPKSRSDTTGDNVVVPSGSRVLPTAEALSVYEHHTDYRAHLGVPGAAERQLDQYRNATELWTGKSVSLKLFAGGRFSLSNEKFVVTLIHHDYQNPDLPTEGQEQRDLYRTIAAVAQGDLAGVSSSNPKLPAGYGNRFEAAAAIDKPVRPPRPDKRTRRAVSETAVVVGAAGEEICVDKHGRIRVQFHWDREGNYRDKSSCWIRVVQTWAGTGYGFQFIPRVGMEVLVAFAGGDPDRPIVVGSLYNATHPTPEPLPLRQTRSGIRTQTSPGGNGFNELSFEDAAGVERLYMHAQKDMHVVVNDGHVTTVRGKQETVVGNEQQTTVRGNQLVGVSNNAYAIVGKDRTSHVGGDSVSRVIGRETSTVTGDASHAVKGSWLDRTFMDRQEIVQGNRNLSVHGHSIDQIGGSVKDETGDANHVLFVQGNSYYTASGSINIRAAKPDDTEGTCITLTVGTSLVELTANGVTVKGKKLTLHGEDEVEITSKKVTIDGTNETLVIGKDSGLKLSSGGAVLGGGSKVFLSNSSNDALSLDGGKAELIGSGATRVKGPSVKLTSGSATSEQVTRSSTNEERPTTSNNFKIKLTHDKDRSDMGNVDYRLVTDGGFIHQGQASSGVIETWIPDTTKLVKLTVYANRKLPKQYKKPLEHMIRIVPSFAGAAELEGIWMRLRNIGHSIEQTLEQVTPQLLRRGLIRFQREHELDTTGENDSDTQNHVTTAAGA